MARIMNSIPKNIPTEAKPRLSVSRFPFSIPKQITAYGQILWMEFLPRTITLVRNAEVNTRKRV
jgi:hypothetical protein